MDGGVVEWEGGVFYERALTIVAKKTEIVQGELAEGGQREVFCGVGKRPLILLRRSKWVII